MSKDMAELTRRLADTAIEQNELYQAAKHDAEEAEAYATELEAAFSNMSREYTKRGDRIKELESKLTMSDLMDRFKAAADALAALASKSRNATNNAFAAGTEEREGGSGRRQGKMMDQYDAWHKEMNAALTEYRAARDAIEPPAPARSIYDYDAPEGEEEDRDAYNLRVHGLREDDFQ